MLVRDHPKTSSLEVVGLNLGSLFNFVEDGVIDPDLVQIDLILIFAARDTMSPDVVHGIAKVGFGIGTNDLYDK